jgi:mannose-1-phosphate guanylyltransferase
MLPVGPKPILEHIVDWLKSHQIKDIVIATGYLGRIIEQYFEDGSAFGVNIEYARSDRPMGHAGQLKSAQKILTPTFVCMYGDAILDFDLQKLIAFHEKKSSFLTMALMSYETKMKYGVIRTNPQGRVIKWKEKPAITSDINVGCYVIEKKFLDYIPRGQMYGMKEAVKSAMDDEKGVYALKVKGRFVDIGDREAHKEADQEYIERYGKIP